MIRAYASGPDGRVTAPIASDDPAPGRMLAASTRRVGMRRTLIRLSVVMSLLGLVAILGFSRGDFVSETQVNHSTRHAGHVHVASPLTVHGW